MDESRRQQLIEGDFGYWVFRVGDPLSCPAAHIELDGLALPPDHPFWTRFAAPVSSRCRCYVVGARNERGIRRLGGDPDKTLPDWWQVVDPASGEMPG